MFKKKKILLVIIILLIVILGGFWWRNQTKAEYNKKTNETEEKQTVSVAEKIKKLSLKLKVPMTCDYYSSIEELLKVKKKIMRVYYLYLVALR